MMAKPMKPSPNTTENPLGSSPKNKSAQANTTPMKKKNNGAINIFLGAAAYAFPAFSFIIMIEETSSSWLLLHANPFPRSIKQSLHRPFPQHLHIPIAVIFS